MPAVAANGISLNVQSLGHEGPQVVMVHGLMASLSSWYFGPAPQLSKGRQVTLYDLRGHGLSERPQSGYGLRSMAGDLAAIIDGVAERPVDIVGHSYGSAVALRYALDHPEKVKGLFLIELPYPVAASAEQIKLLNTVVEYISQKDARQDWLSVLPPEVIDDLLAGLPAPVRQLIETKQAKLANRALSQMIELTRQTDLIAELVSEPELSADDLACLPTPTVLCYGSRSPGLFSRDTMISYLPRAQVQMLDGGHFLMNEPEVAAQLTRLIEDFIDG